MTTLADAPEELQCAIREFWPDEEWDHAAQIAELESGFNPFAEADTRDLDHPCGSVLRVANGMRVSAEWSIGYFQINVCNLPAEWDSRYLFNARHNAGTAHDLWARRGWQPWYFSATKLGIL